MKKLLLLFAILFGMSCAPKKGIVKFSDDVVATKHVSPASVTIVMERTHQVTKLKRKWKRKEWYNFARTYENCKWKFEKRLDGIHYHITCK